MQHGFLLGCEEKFSGGRLIPRLADDYYMQDECWREQFNDGLSAKDAVDSDMGYWD